jgi:exopolyphosphatase/guanosine-5'-triphosphate,3'-diphosphate pyrophosphatase
VTVDANVAAAAPAIRTRRVAAVDVGTNSIRLIVAEVRSDGSYRLLDDEKVVARLGRGMHESPALGDDAMRGAAQAIARMKAIAEGYHAEIVRGVATWAVREASNRKGFIELVKAEAGLDLDVISGADEGRLAFLSVKNAFDLEGDVAVVDIGGGSTEIVVSAGGVVEHIHSLPLGAIHLTESVRGDEGTTPAARLRRLRNQIRDEVKRRLPKPDRPASLVIGTGGTFTTLGNAELHRRRRPAPADDLPLNVRGVSVTRAEIRRLIEQLGPMSVEERAAVPGIGPDRAEIIVAGIGIASAIMKRLGAETLQVHDRGIRDGLLLSMMHELFPETAESSDTPDRLRAVRRFAERCNYERNHSEHVTELAIQIFDQLAEQLDGAASDNGDRPPPPPALLDPASRELLATAGVLHDVGYLVNYSRHHRHSYHLIMHSDLAGFDHRELEVVANVARYHRRAHPKKSHPNFARLAPDEQERVRALAAILRIADGLDRAHAGNVERVKVEIERHTAWFTVEAEREPEVDLWGAARKSQLFPKVFNMDPRFLWAGERAAASKPASTPS